MVFSPDPFLVVFSFDICGHINLFRHDFEQSVICIAD